MKTRAGILAVVGLVAGCGAQEGASLEGALGASKSELTPVYFLGSYNGDTNGNYDCTTSRRIDGQEPQEAGTYPVLLYIPGSFEWYDGVQPDAFVKRAAALGFVAGSLEYRNSFDGICTSSLNSKLHCAASWMNYANAINALCGRAKADCNTKGIVVVGHSQGGAMALLSGNHDSRVRAVVAMGVSDLDPVVGGMTNSCVLASGGRSLANSKVRLVMGANDFWAGWTYNDYGTSLNRVAGTACANNAASCLNADGSGWYRPQTSEVSSGNPDKHCYYQNNGNNTDCGNAYWWETGKLDANYVASGATAAWTRDATINWLKSRTTP